MRLSFAGATFFRWHDFFSLARLFSQALICRSLLVFSHFLTCGATFLRWRDCIFAGATFFLLARLFFAGATFFCWRDFFSLARLYFCWRDFFFAGATFFRWHDFFSLARLFSQALICRSLLVLWRAQTTSTYSCKQDG